MDRARHGAPDTARPAALARQSGYDAAAMNREIASNDRLVRKRWPVLFWANIGTLIAAAACLATVIALLVYETTGLLQISDRSALDRMIGAAYVLTAVFGVAFMLTGYLRLFMVHLAPSHAPQSRAVRRQFSPFQRLAGAVVLLGALSAGWLHWGWGTAILFLVVFAVVYLPILLR